MKQNYLMAVYIITCALLLGGCVSTKMATTVLNDDFSTFNEDIWEMVEGKVFVDNGVLIIDCEGNNKGFIRHSLPLSDWRVVELRAKVEKVYGRSVGDIISRPSAVYYSNSGSFCVWDRDGQRGFAEADNEWHTWKIMRTDAGAAIYMDGTYKITNSRGDPEFIILGNELADQNHGMRTLYDWIKVK